MLIDVLGLSAAFLAGSTGLLLIAGRWRLPGYLLRTALLVLIALVVGVLTGRIDPSGLGPHVPDPFDPLTVAALLTLAIALAAPRSWWAVGSVTFASLVAATSVYVLYLVTITAAMADSPLGLVMGLVLLLFQVVALFLMIASMFEMVDALCRPLEVPDPPQPPAEWPTVAFQVPTHQEPPDLIIETIRSVAGLDYPRERLVIQVIDNNTTDEALWKPVEAESARLREQGHRVEFTHLADWPGFKAGALNWGTAHLSPDVQIVTIVDADYVVEPGFLKATIPYFLDPRVAFVQTPQEYRDWQQSAFYRACHTGFAYFFTVGMVSRSYRNSIIFAGTMGLIRRAALDAIGGWDENVITEDAEASLRILALGYRGIYVPRPFGQGIMPLTYEGLRKQRFRWAFGGMQILRKHGGSLLPWSRSGLNQRQRRDYLLGGLGWFNDALTLGFGLFIGATALGVLTNHPFVVQRLQGIGLVLPILYISLGLIRYLWGLRVATGATLTEAAAALRINLSLSWLVTLALIRGSIEKRGVFLRTPKFQGSAAGRSLRMVWVEALLFAGAAIMAVAILFFYGASPLTLTVGTLLAWSALIYGSAVSFALGDPNRPPESLRQKAALELTQGTVGRAIERAPAVGAAGALVLGIVALVVGLLAEGGRPLEPGGRALIPPGALAQGPSPAPSAGASGAPSPAASGAGSAPPRASTIPSAGPSATPAPTPPPTAPPATPAPTPPASAPASPAASVAGAGAESAAP